MQGLVLIGRRHLRSNNSWMHNLPSLVKGPTRAPAHASARRRERGLTDGARVEVRSRPGAVQAELELSETIARGVVSLPHGFGHAPARATLRVAGALPAPSVNDLTDELKVEPILGTSI